jgi:hypothetical protein
MKCRALGKPFYGVFKAKARAITCSSPSFACPTGPIPASTSAPIVKALAGGDDSHSAPSLGSAHASISASIFASAFPSIGKALAGGDDVHSASSPGSAHAFVYAFTSASASTSVHIAKLLAGGDYAHSSPSPGSAHAFVSDFPFASPPIKKFKGKTLAGVADSHSGPCLSTSANFFSAPIGIRKALAIGTSGSTAFGSWVPPVERLETLNTLKSAAPVMSEDSTGTPEVSFLIAHQA